MILHLGRVPVTEDNLLATLPSWGPTYRVTLSLYINSFDGDNLLRGKWAELLRFTSTDNNCCAMGDRVPAIFTNKGGFIQVATQLGDNANRWRNVFLEEKTWYTLEILQFFQNNKVSKILNIFWRFFRVNIIFSIFWDWSWIKKFWSKWKILILLSSTMYKCGLQRQLIISPLLMPTLGTYHMST